MSMHFSLTSRFREKIQQRQKANDPLLQRKSCVQNAIVTSTLYPIVVFFCRYHQKIDVLAALIKRLKVYCLDFVRIANVNTTECRILRIAHV